MATPFVQLIVSVERGPAIRNVVDLAEVLRRICPTEAVKNAFLAGIGATRTHLHEIELWFQV